MNSDELSRHTARIRYDDNGCWTWTGALLRSVRPGNGGYPIAQVDGKTVLAHRAFYTHYVGPITTGAQLDHLCRNRACVNPEHLEPVTQRVNIMRGVGPTALNVTKTHCPKDHPYDGANLYVDPTGRRHCRECSRARTRAWLDNGGREWHRANRQRLKE